MYLSTLRVSEISCSNQRSLKLLLIVVLSILQKVSQSVIFTDFENFSENECMMRKYLY